MPKPLNFFDVEDVHDTCFVRVHEHVGAVPQREFAVEANLLRSYLLEVGHQNLLVEVLPASELVADQLRALVILIREVRQRGGAGAFCGGGAQIQQSLKRFGFSKPEDWFPSAAAALATIAGIAPPPVQPSVPAAVVLPVPNAVVPAFPYGAVPTAPYPVAPQQAYVPPPPQVFAGMPPHPYPTMPMAPPGLVPPGVGPAAPASMPVPPTVAAPVPFPAATQRASGWVPPPRGRFLPAHELTLRGHHRQPVLATAAACRHLAEQIGNVSRQMRFSVWAFVFMPDHFHLLVQSQQLNYDIGEFLESIKAAFQAKGVDVLDEHAPDVLNRLRRRQGSQYVYDFWQKTTGQNRNIDFSRPLRPLINHLHENPVRRGLVARATDWKWSSAGAYAGHPLAELQPDPPPPELLGP